MFDPRYIPGATRALIAATGLLLAVSAARSAASIDDSMYTRWNVSTCLGLEAVVFIGALSGSGLQRDYFQSDVESIRAKFDDESLLALDRLAEVADLSGTLIGPNLAFLFSAGPAETLDDVIRSARYPEKFLRRNLERSQYWDAQEWEWFRDETMPDVLIVLEALRDADFESHWRSAAFPILGLRVEATQKYLRRFDIIPEHERLLGRDLEPEISVLLMHFSRPYGIRVTGQRFASHHSFPMFIQLRTAVHEMFHPPFERADSSIYARLEDLKTDPWMVSIVQDHDPAFGYNSFAELLEESSTQALDQIILDRIDLGQGPGARWRNADGGMHMLAAAIYQMLLEDNFDKTGGNFAEWLDSAIERGLFAPEEVKRRATIIVGKRAVSRWPKDDDARR